MLPLSRRSDIQLRRVEECAQFLTPSKTDEEYDGRISGSVQWRQSRNEYKPKSNKYIWTPNEIEIQRKRCVDFIYLFFCFFDHNLRLFLQKFFFFFSNYYY